MRTILFISLALLAVTYALVDPPYGVISALVAIGIAVAVVFFLRKDSENHETLTNIFLVALGLRLTLGLVIAVFGLEELFGPDAFVYDGLAKARVAAWNEGSIEHPFQQASIAAWGMQYFVTFLYLVFGSSILVAQATCGVIGAITAPMVYYCSLTIFNNKRAATIAGFSIAVFPSFVIWSSQMLKDGLITFLLVVVMLLLLRLQKKTSVLTLGALLMSLMAIVSLRFYIFYMVVVAIAGSFTVGLGNSSKALLRNFVLIILVGTGLTYVGFSNNAVERFQNLTDLQYMQAVRSDLAKSADSGFGEDVDVSTVRGAITAVPVGFVYLMFAPFPWQIGKLSQALVFPETVLWWCLMPLLISGLAYSLRRRFDSSVPIMLFSTLLAIAYSIFQGNVGMAYRQRTQIQVFLFIFISVGITLFLEKRENAKSARANARRRRLEAIRAP